jgi:hypothetical protein
MTKEDVGDEPDRNGHDDPANGEQPRIVDPGQRRQRKDAAEDEQEHRTATGGLMRPAIQPDREQAEGQQTAKRRVQPGVVDDRAAKGNHHPSQSAAQS